MYVNAVQRCSRSLRATRRIGWLCTAYCLRVIPRVSTSGSSGTNRKAWQACRITVMVERVGGFFDEECSQVRERLCSRTWLGRSRPPAGVCTRSNRPFLFWLGSSTCPASGNACDAMAFVYAVGGHRTTALIRSSAPKKRISWTSCTWLPPTKGGLRCFYFVLLRHFLLELVTTYQLLVSTYIPHYLYVLFGNVTSR